MKLAVVAIIALFALAGCGCPERYVAGENFGNGGATPCGSRQAVDGYNPLCPPPDDGDAWDSRHYPPQV